MVTLQELQMLSSVTLNRQIVKMIVLNSDSQNVKIAFSVSNFTSL